MRCVSLHRKRVNRSTGNSASENVLKGKVVLDLVGMAISV